LGLFHVDLSLLGRRLCLVRVGEALPQSDLASATEVKVVSPHFKGVGHNKVAIRIRGSNVRLSLPNQS